MFGKSILNKWGKLILLCSLLMLCLSGCDSDSSKEFWTEGEGSHKTYEPLEENVKLLGRTHYVQDSLWLVLSGSGVEFTFTGTKATITLQADSSYKGGVDSQARVAILVDGKCVVDDMVDQEEKTYQIFEGEEPQECVVRVIKLSEAPVSSVGIKKIDVDAAGEIKPTPQREHLIEFIGDSITCGYGTDDEVKDHSFSTKTENVMKTYAYKTAEALNADYSMVCYSGHGVISGYSENGEKATEPLVPRFYTKLGYTHTTYMGLKAIDVDWDFSKRQPDVIVINLGTNDESYTGYDKAKQKEYTNGYVAFLKQIRELNPNATILCTLGIVGDCLYSSTQKAVEEYKSQTGDTNIDCMKFDIQQREDGLAADWHPTEKTHTKASVKLTAKIRELMGW